MQATDHKKKCSTLYIIIYVKLLFSSRRNRGYRQYVCPCPEYSILLLCTRYSKKSPHTRNKKHETVYCAHVYRKGNRKQCTALMFTVKETGNSVVHSCSP